MLHKVLSFGSPILIKVVPIISSESKHDGIKEDPKQYIEEVFICLNRTSCSKVTLSDDHEYVTIYDREPFTLDDYQKIWFFHARQLRKSGKGFIPEYIILEFTQIDPPEEIHDFLEFVAIEAG